MLFLLTLIACADATSPDGGDDTASTSGCALADANPRIEATTVDTYRVEGDIIEVPVAEGEAFQVVHCGLETDNHDCIDITSSYGSMDGLLCLLPFSDTCTDIEPVQVGALYVWVWHFPE